MPILVACPSCGGKLRIADALRGQRVRCPACNHTFDGDAEPSPAPRDLPLQLAIDEPSAPPSAPANGPRGLVGAVELPGSPSDEPAAPPPPQPPPRETPRRREVNDDLKECPACGRFIHHDSTRCYHCGERFEEKRSDWDRLDIRRRPPRRDSERDRGAIVLTLGIISVACLMVWCTPIGVILGLTAWIMGQTDLRKIKSGQMDENGRSMTQAGWICGILGTLLNGLVTLGCGGLIGLMWYTDVSRPPNTRPIYTNPPAMKKPAAPPKPAPQWK